MSVLALFNNQINLFYQKFFPSFNLLNATNSNFSNLNVNQNENFDIVIIGGGIIGCATARELSRRNKNFKLALLEKENSLALHQSGHNSGVIHAGIYYTPGTLKAKLCVQGFYLMYDYLKKKNIPFKKCGKLIIAVEESELNNLHKLYQNGINNGVKDLKLISSEEISKIEPECKGIKAIWSPNTGVVDYSQVTKSFANDFEENGGKIYLNFKVSKLSLNELDQNYPVSILSEQGKQLNSKFVVTTAGLYSDKLALMTGCDNSPQIIPFRGEYLKLKPSKSNLIRTNIYPVPNASLPFLGIHFTPTINNDIILGPNAILATKREGYSKLDFNLFETIDSLKFIGLWKLCFKYLWFGLKELYCSFSIKEEVSILQKYVPNLNVLDVERGFAGVRAQALDRNGKLVEDFVFDSGKGEISKHVLHVRNAPSPGATSSLAIAKMIADKIKDDFKII